MMRAAAALGGVAVLASVPFWLFYAYYVFAIGLAGENCIDSSRARCEQGAPLVFGLIQALLCLVGVVLGVRAGLLSVRYGATGAGGTRTRNALLAVAGVAATWVAMLAVRAATAGTIY